MSFIYLVWIVLESCFASQLSQMRELRTISLPLASGWDNTGRAIYESTRQQISKSLKYSAQHSTLVIKTDPMGPVTYFDGPWKGWLYAIAGKPTWEPNTFQIFNKYLPMVTHYIDFGAWIGVTLFYATQLVDFAIGIEGDPAAYAYASCNLGLNVDKSWRNHTKMVAAAVGLGSQVTSAPEKVVMHSPQAGGSCSGLGATHRCGNPLTDPLINWTVMAYPLAEVMMLYEIPLSKRTFIKIDVESFECRLISSWKRWLLKFGGVSNKPTLFISFHPHIERCSEGEYKEISKIAAAYKYIHCSDSITGKKYYSCRMAEWRRFENLQVIFSDLK